MKPKTDPGEKKRLARSSEHTIPLGTPAVDAPVPDPTVLVDPAKVHADVQARIAAQGATLFLPGRRIGPYEVVRELGRGAMGVVLLAQHSELKREVALKVLAGGATADADAIERFRRESEAVARLDHPGVVKLYERGQADGCHYYAMEYVKGTALDTVIRRERASYIEAARIIAQCAHAIDYAHGQGILHRDVKPANILLEPSGRARLTDFGLARFDQKATLTTEGTVVGTPLYLAPEVARGGRATRKSDIYSLGATLYELATGLPPYEGRDAQTVMMRVLAEAPKPPTEADPRIPKDLVRIIGRAMAREADDRYPVARALALDLEKFAAGRSLEIAGSGGAFRQSAAVESLRRGTAWIGLVVGLVVLVGLVLYLNERRKEAERQREKLLRQLEEAQHSLNRPAGGFVDPSVEGEALRYSADRRIKALTRRNKLLHDDARDEGARRTFNAIVTRARETSEGAAVSLYRQALDYYPHDWAVRIELGRALGLSDFDEAEAELSLVLSAEQDLTNELRALAYAERGRLYRMRGGSLMNVLAADDLQHAISLRRTATVATDLAYCLAATGRPDEAAAILERLPIGSADDVARALLARVAIARARGENSAAEAELARVRDMSLSDDLRRLVELEAR